MYMYVCMCVCVFVVVVSVLDVYASVWVCVSCLCVFVVYVSAVVVVCSCIYQNIIGLPGLTRAHQIASVVVCSRPDYTPGQL